VLIEGKAIQAASVFDPRSTPIDGDQMAARAGPSRRSWVEARALMMSSNNLSPGQRDHIIVPS